RSCRQHRRAASAADGKRLRTRLEVSWQTHSLLTRGLEPATATSVSTLEPKQIGGHSDMNRIRTAVMGAAIAGSMVIGGVVGAAVYGVSALNAAAATTATTAASPSPTSGSSSGTFVSNEAAAHEATESAAREAQANAG